MIAQRLSLFKIFIFGFFFLMVVRLGIVIDDSGVLKAYAKEIDLKQKIQDNTANMPQSIQDKLTKPSTIKDDPDFNPYSLQEIKRTKKQNPQDVCLTGPILEAAKNRLEFLEKREQELLEQQRLIEAADRRVREQSAKLQLIKDEIVEQAQLADSKIAKESKRLISIYEKMKPKDAANIFNEMSPKVAAELLRSMKEDQSSAILAKMSPKIAYDVTLALSGNIKETESKYNKLR